MHLKSCFARSRSKETTLDCTNEGNLLRKTGQIAETFFAIFTLAQHFAATIVQIMHGTLGSGSGKPYLGKYQSWNTGGDCRKTLR